MTTTDTDALKKRLARALYVIWWTDHMQDPSASYDHPLNEDAREACESAADALLPVVAEEARKAKAEALREAAENVHTGTDLNPTMHDGQDYFWWAGYLQRHDQMWRHRLNERATEYETGDTDEHR